MRTLLTAFTLLLPATVAAQTPPCFSLNDANTTVSNAVTSAGFSGQNTRAWQVTPTNTLGVQSVQFFTRNTALAGDKFMIVEIWSDVAGLPGTLLGSGAWRIVNARPFAWQGANLDQLVVIPANTPVWVAWIEQGFSTPPEEPGGVTMPRANRSNAGVWSLVAAPTAPKVRLFCTLQDDLYTVPFGTACPQSTGRFSTMFTNEQPTLGNAGFFFETSGNPSGGPVFVVIGFDPLWVSLPVAGLPTGCMQNTDIVATLFVFAGTGTSRGPTCAGYQSVPIGIPADPGLTGQLISAQAVPYDAGASTPLPFASSNAQRIILY